eukprot:15449330-Alexandrium_andersonii.AAC.1
MRSPRPVLHLLTKTEEANNRGHVSGRSEFRGPKQFDSLGTDMFLNNKHRPEPRTSVARPKQRITFGPDPGGANYSDPRVAPGRGQENAAAGVRKPLPATEVLPTALRVLNFEGSLRVLNPTHCTRDSPDPSEVVASAVCPRRRCQRLRAIQATLPMLRARACVRARACARVRAENWPPLEVAR